MAASKAIFNVLLMVVSVLGQTPEEIIIKEKPSGGDLLVKAGVEQSLTCTTIFTGDFKWEYPTKGKPGTRENSHFTNENHQVSSLTIGKFSQEFAGDYICSINSPKEGLLQEIVSLLLVEESKTEPNYHFGNKTATLACDVNVKGYSVESIRWLRGDEAVASLPDSERFIENITSNSLTINDPSRDDVGVYTAEIKMSGVDTPYKCDVHYKEAALQIQTTKIEPTFVKGNKTALLSCQINANGRKVERMEWLKNDTLVSKLDDSNRFEAFPNNSLIIDDPKRSDADLYIARFFLVGEKEPFNCKVQFKAAPRVLKFTKSKNLMENDKLELFCKVYGYPRATVRWFKNDKPLNVSTESRITLEAKDGYDNAHLTIKDVEFGDKGDYSCEAFSAFFNESSQETVIVRVKDKLAALWPFLGIVLEVIVLCTIIFLYEKRRNKLAEQEEKNTHEAEPAIEKKEGLRHRGNGNPTA